MTDDTTRDDKSRSQVKREFRELKELGKQLVDLSPGQLQAIPLTQKTRDAVLAAKQMTRRALQRQYRHLQSLLAEEDATTVLSALRGELQPHADDVARLHEAETWREKLLSGDELQLAELVDRYPECDRTRLRQLVRNARKERDLDKPSKAARQLFRLLRELFEIDGSQTE